MWGGSFEVPTVRGLLSKAICLNCQGQVTLSFSLAGAHPLGIHCAGYNLFDQTCAGPLDYPLGGFWGSVKPGTI
jgi:hypothetical protein